MFFCCFVLDLTETYVPEDIYNNLMCVVKCGDTVLATEVISVTKEKIKRDTEGAYVEFADTITVPDVSSDFKISIEVYNLVVEKKDTSANNSKKVSIFRVNEKFRGVS